jgi:hypothetical protein
VALGLFQGCLTAGGQDCRGTVGGHRVIEVAILLR